MRFSAALSVTGLAWTVLSAPVPIVLVKIGEVTAHSPASLGAHPPALVREDQVNSGFLDKAGIPADDVVIDNRPFQPSENDDPTKVLAVERPVTTSYLMSLTGHRYASPKSSSSSSSQKMPEPHHHDERIIIIDASDLPEAALEALEASTIAQMEIGFRERMVQQLGRMSCYRLRRDYNDMLVVGAVVVFVLVVLLIETWEALRESGTCVLNRRQGQIRLETEDPAAAEKRALSIQASGPSGTTQ